MAYKPTNYYKKPRNLCVTVNTLCNWDCSYCIAETNLNSKSIKKERSEERLFLKAIDILQKVDPLEYDTITISGGEPGLLPFQKLIEILQIGYFRGFNIDINSNGKILNKLYPYIYEYNTWKDVPNYITDENFKIINILKTIDTIDIHLFPTINTGIEVLKDNTLLYNIDLFKYSFSDIYQVFKEFGIKIRPLMVVGKSDLENLEKFILAFTDTFNPILNGFELELRICVDNESGNNPEKLNTTEILNTIRTIHKYKIISRESLELAELTLESIKVNRYS